MPTVQENQQRSQAICNAIVNGVATAEQVQLLAEAIYNVNPASYAALTNAQKAAIIPRWARQNAIRDVDQYDDNLTRAAKVPAASKLPEAE